MSLNTTCEELATLHETGNRNPLLRIVRQYGAEAPLPARESGAPAIPCGRGLGFGLLALGLLIGLGVNLDVRATAQTLTVLHHFTGLSPYTNIDGAAPNGFVLSGNTLYGTAQFGGTGNNGTGRQLRRKNCADW